MSTNTKLNFKLARKIRKLYDRGYSVIKLAEKFDVSVGPIYRILSGKVYSSKNLLCACGCGKRVICNGGKWLKGHRWRMSEMKDVLRKNGEYARTFIPKIRPYHSIFMKHIWKSSEYRNKIKLKWNEQLRKDTDAKKSATMIAQYASGERVPVPNRNWYSSGWIDTVKGGTVYYDSSWELAFIEIIESAKIIKHFKKNPFPIPYYYEGKWHSYFPDFFLEFRDGRKFLVEIKGKMDEKTRAKHLAAYRYCVKHGYEWVFITEKPIHPITDYLQ